MKKKLLISFSGGRTSAYMTQWLLKNKADEYEMIVVFSNTGKERKETLDFIKKCDGFFGFNVIWIEPVTSPIWGIGMRSKVVTYDTADRTGKPFESMIKKYGIPNRTRPFCSEYMKRNTIRHYARSIGWKDYYTAIGIRVDEFDRMSIHRKKEKLLYPLVSMVPTNKGDIASFFSKLPFDLQLKSYEGNCDFCWKKSLRKHLTIAKENPELLNWWIRIENKFANFIPPSSKIKGYMPLPIRFFRNNMTAKSLLDLSQKEFEPAIDDSKTIPKYKQTDLFNEPLDPSNGCEDSCEAF